MTNQERFAWDLLSHDAEWACNRLMKIRRSSTWWSDSREYIIDWFGKEECLLYEEELESIMSNESDGEKNENNN